MEQLSVLNRGISILNEIRDNGILAAPPTALPTSGGDFSGAVPSSSSSMNAGSGALSKAPSFVLGPTGSSPGLVVARGFGGEAEGGGAENAVRVATAAAVSKGGAQQLRRGKESNYTLPSQAPPRLTSSNI